MADDNVVRLGAHSRMKPDEALALASAEDWDKVLILGFHVDDGAIVMRSSHMTRETANWIIDHAKAYILGLDSM